MIWAQRRTFSECHRCFCLAWHKIRGTGSSVLKHREDLWRGFRRHRCFKASDLIPVFHLCRRCFRLHHYSYLCWAEAADTFKLLDADARMALRPNTQIITGIWHDTVHDTAWLSMIWCTVNLTARTAVLSLYTPASENQLQEPCKIWLASAVQHSWLVHIARPHFTSFYCRHRTGL